MKQLIIAILLCIAQPLYAQTENITISGQVKEQKTNLAAAYATIILKTEGDSTFVMGTVSEEDGRFSLKEVKSGNYFLEIKSTGFIPKRVAVTAGRLNNFLDMGTILLSENEQLLQEIVISGKADEINAKMDKKTFDLAANLTQTGASALEAMKNLPGVSVQDGKIQLRGNDKVMVLVDGKQTALTGMGGQSGLDNIPASAIEKIEVINNPSARFDANGNAGIINIIYRKEKQEGFNGKVGFTGGLGALWVKKESYPGIRPQYTATPKLNPSLSLNYRKKKLNLFVQADNLYTKTLNKNELADRFYNNGETIRQQTVRNRTTNVITGKTGLDWQANERNTLNFSTFFSSEKILDRGDEPFFNADLSQQQRLWRFLEDELKTTLTLSSGWQHQFRQPGRKLSAGFNYTYHRENEQYFFTNILPSYTGLDSFKLISDEHVADLTLDYVQPLKYGRVEGGIKLRRRYIPVNMQFIPGLNSPLDTNAGGWANYTETIPAVYGNYILESKKFEVEAGLRLEYVSVQYDVNPGHNTYKSDGYQYTQPFPNMRLSYKLDDRNRFSVFYNRRVDRPNEVDIRIFPKYDDAEIIKVGNPALRPQFTNAVELGYKTSWKDAYLYTSLYHRMMDATITRISSTVGSSPLIYNIFQNAGRSYTSGIEMLLSQRAGKWAEFNLNLNAYQNIIEAFSVENLYPQRNTFSAARQELFSGNVKLNGLFHLPRRWDAQFSAIYQAPDIIPQGTIDARFSIDLGVRKAILKGKGELFANATDIANTLRIKRTIQGDGFRYISTDYYETQVIRAGFTFKF
ncbi:MAG TPA: outer membrane beta-barrel protein [Chitinophagaceae bacterium]|nr:outer membrane beta-barrel protein [Chitinophagaceae bacterium]